MPGDLPSKISELKQKGTPTSKIIENLKQEGHSSQEIYDSMSNNSEQPNAGEYATSSLEAPSPSEKPEPSKEETPQQPNMMFPTEKTETPSIPSRQQIEQIEEVAEAIVDEKWQQLSSTLSNLSMWKERVSSEIDAIKQETLRIRNVQENLQNTILGKVESYNQNISTISAEMRALEKVFGKIIAPLTSNIKELSRITDALKKPK